MQLIVGTDFTYQSPNHLLNKCNDLHMLYFLSCQRENMFSNAQLDLNPTTRFKQPVRLAPSTSQPRTFAWTRKDRRTVRWQMLQTPAFINLPAFESETERSERVILTLAHWWNPPEESGLIVCQQVCRWAVTATGAGRLWRIAALWKNCRKINAC